MADPPPPPRPQPLAFDQLGLRLRYGLAVGCGLLYFLAFPGMDVWPLAFVAWLPLLVAMQGVTARQALLLAWTSGLTMTTLGFYWLQEMLETFSGFPAPICFVFLVLLSGYQGGRIALMGWLYGRGVLRGWPRGLVFALAFAASEQLFPLLFIWYFGATVHQVPALTQIAELGNPIAVGLTLVAANWALFLVLEALWRRRAVPARRVAALLAVPALSALFGAWRIGVVDERVAAADKIRVGVVQANMSLMGKRHDRREGLRRHVRLTQQLESESPLDLAIWSETSVAGAVREEHAEAFYKQAFTAKLGIPTLFGAVLSRPVDDARQVAFSNSALMVDRQGNLLGRYDKQYLLAFGEYLPFGEWFPVLYQWSPNTGRFAAGTSLAALPLGDYQVSAHICYEDIIPGFINSMLRADNADLLVNMTNDAWFGDSTEPWIHLALAKFRAVEHRRFLVRSTNSGVSAIIDPVGRVLNSTDTFEQAAIAGQVAMLRPAPTVYERLGNAPWWLVALAAGWCAFRRPPHRNKGPLLR